MSASPLAAHPLLPESRVVRERDLAGLVLALLLTAGPHALRAPWWLVALTLTLYAWRALILVNRWDLPRRGFVLLIAAAALLGVWLEYRMIFGRGPGIVLLMFFSGLKLLETRTHRDAAIVAYLCCFLVITNFLYSQSIPIALLMVAALYVVTVTLVGCNAPGRPLRADLRTGASLLLQAAPAALALFLLFPRVEGPTWGLPRDSRVGITGLSETMTPGAVSELARSDALAFRADFSGPLPAPRQRYWRGPVLWDFDGRSWHAGAPLLRREPDAPRGGQTYRYSVVLEPQQNRWLFALESAAQLPPGARLTADRQLLAAQAIRSRQRYEMSSVADANVDADELPGLLQRALALPQGSNPRALELASAWRREARSANDILLRGVEHFRAGQFRYTLEPALLGRDSVDEFLFATREGFCEHFASAFAFLMRAAGVPSRVVTGYLGGDPNPVDGILTLRQSDAHAWVEVHLPGRGWVRVDPTAAAVPSRLDFGLARAVPQGTALPLLMQPQFEWLLGIRHRWDALAHQWNLRVLGYNTVRQREFMSWLGMPSADWQALVATLAATLGSLALLLLAWSLRRTGRADAVERVWRRYCARLARRGMVRAPHEGPADFTDRAARQWPRAEDRIRRIGSLYIDLRYGRGEGPEALRELSACVRGLKLA